MSDCERIDQFTIENKTGDRDDLGGMIVNMFSSPSGWSLAIIWLVYIFIHTEGFSDHVLKKFSGATNSDGTMTMRGTIYSSIFMIFIIILCTLIFST